MALVLNKWENLIYVTINPYQVKVNSLSDEFIQSLIEQSDKEQEEVRNAMIEWLVDKPKVRDKQQFVQLNQAILIRLLDKLYLYKQEEHTKQIANLYEAISRHLESTLSFIEDFFGNYFDKNERVPAGYLKISLEELCNKLEQLTQTVIPNSSFGQNLSNIIIENFNKFCYQHSQNVTYNELIYQKELMDELLTDETLKSEQSVKELLFYFNFNDADYISYLYKRLSALIDSSDVKQEKISILRFEQKTINQLTTKLNTQLSAYMPSLKEQVNQWIEEEIKFLEATPQEPVPLKNEQEQDEKLHLSLSVAKIALLLRLMILDKVITNRVITHVLRIMVKTVTTLQRENISFGSLETKYHNPDRGTISAVKDMLFRWINILSKL
ncbi:MAG TPA: hypothetical protein VFW07_15490 [Parafilimonas sp.]|nr:hypothetical protein [Parafilimonas sp.]